MGKSPRSAWGFAQWTRVLVPGIFVLERSLLAPRIFMSDQTLVQAASLSKAPSGIRGLDEITGGGLPRGRPTLVAGGPGCGKTLAALQFVARGATDFDEPGVFFSFEEPVEDVVRNASSVNLELRELVDEGRLHLEHVRIDAAETEAAGRYDLDGLFVRLARAIDRVGARRVALDTLDSIFSTFAEAGILRSELRRLFGWLKDEELTTLVTAEQGDGSLTRHGLEEYVADCVIFLDHRVDDEIPTRRLRIVKYRGTGHGTNEYPFLIDDDGVGVMPITSTTLDHDAPAERVSTGVEGIDAILGGEGLYRASTTLVSGTAGSGKSMIGCHFVDAACRRAEPALYFAFEESPRQILRNMRSVGLDLEPHLESGLLHIESTRPSVLGLEKHLVRILRLLDEHEPRVVVFDPITSLVQGGSRMAVRTLSTRLIDGLKARDVTALFLALTSQGGPAEMETSHVEVSSIMDSWLVVRDVERDGERRRSIYVIKSRGMEHSRQVHEMRISDRGIEMAPGGVDGAAGDGDGRGAPDVAASSGRRS